VTGSRALTVVAVVVAGACGAVLRHEVVQWWELRRPIHSRDGVAVVNVCGAFALGLLITVRSDGALRLVLGTGLLGGLTTFSTWIVLGARAGAKALVRDIILHAGLGIPAAALGMALGEALA
jgi:CrcB protein